jgi:hypothetical protein
MSAVWLLALTCGLVFAAIKTFQFFESRYGVDVILNPEQALTPPAEAETIQRPAIQAPTETQEAKIESPSADEDDAIRQAPRAIIVR